MGEFTPEPESKEKAVKPLEAKPDVPKETPSTRETLGALAFTPQETPEKATRVGDASSRAELRKACGDELATVDKELKEASNAMKEVNLAAQAGHKPGSQKYEESFEKACVAYLKVIKRCEGNLCLYEADGKTRKVDAATGAAKRSPFALGLEKESNMLGTEIQQLQQIQQAGRALTPAEMDAYGVTSNDTKAVLEERVQQRKNVIDLGRSLGYAEANFGLALIRSSGNLQGADKTFQAQEGQKLLGLAAIDDKIMDGPPRDPNFAKHYENVKEKAGLTTDAEGRLIARDAGPVPPRPAVDMNARPVERPVVPQPGDRAVVPQPPAAAARNEADLFGGRNVVKDGNFTLPSDKVDIAQPGFRNPFDVLAATEQQATQPLSSTSHGGFKQAIEAADSLDRVKIKQYMGEAEKVISDTLKNAPAGSPLRRTLEQIQRTDIVMNQIGAKMAQSIPQLETVGGKPAADIINYLRSAKDINELNAKLSHPQNADAIRAFKGLKDSSGQVIGALYVADLQSYMNGKAQKTQLETNLKGLAPNYVNAVADLNKLEGLHHSSEDTRAHYVRSMLADRRNLTVGDPPVLGGDAATKSNAESARKAMIELAVMKPTLLEDADFRAAATALQMGQETFRTGDYRLGQPAPPAGKTTGATDTPISNAYAAYRAADAQQQLTPALEQAFVAALAESRTVNPADITAKRAQLQADLAKSGWSLDPNSPLESAYNGHNKKVLDTFNDISAEQQKVVAQLLVESRQVKGPDEKSVNDQRVAIEAKMQALGQTDPKVAAWLNARAQKAQWIGATPQVQARLIYQAEDYTLTNIEHGPQLIAGMYGHMLLKANRPADAAQYLAAAKGDPVVARMLPEVAALAQQVQERPAQPAPGPKTGADRSGEPSRTGVPGAPEIPVAPLEKGPEGAAPAVAPDAAAVKGQQSLQMAMEAGNFITRDGKPLSEQTVSDDQGRTVQLERIFQLALQNNVGDANRTAAAQTLYAGALSATGNQADLAKAKQYMTEAVKNPDLFAGFPEARGLANMLGVEAPNQRGAAPEVAAPGGPTAAGPSPLDSVVPGFKQFREAAILTDAKDQTWKQRMEKAEPLFLEAIKSSDDILLPETKERFAQVGQQITELETQFNAMTEQQKLENPAQARQMQEQWAKLQKEAEVLNVIRLQPMNSRLVYAFAANQYASDLKEQAAKDPTNAAALQAEAKKYNDIAVKQLKDIGIVDPQYGGNENDMRMVQGAIEQASKGQKMERNSAIALGYGAVATEVVEMGKTPFGFKGAQPAVTALNMTFEAFSVGEQVPVIGKFIGGFGNASPAKMLNAGAVQAVAEAKNIDPATGKLIVDKGKLVSKNGMVHTGIDVIAAPSAIALTNKAIMPLIAKAGLKSVAKNPIAALGVSWLTDVALTKGLDETAHATLNTDRLTNSQLLSHATFSWGSAHAFNKFMGVRANTSANGIAALGDDVVIAGEKMVGKTPASFITQVETKLATQAEADLAAGIKPGSIFADGRSSMTFFEKIRHPFSTKGPTGALMSKAEVEVATNGIATGSRWSYLKPSNAWNAVTGKPGNFVTNEAGAKVFTGTLRDLKATEFMSKWGSLTTAGGISSAIYSGADINPTQTKEDGTHYTWGETFTAAGERGATGLVATGIAAPLVPAIGKFSYKMGIDLPVVKPLQWVFKSDATKALTPLADDAGRMAKMWQGTKEGVHWLGNHTGVNHLRSGLGWTANKSGELITKIPGVAGAGGKVSDIGSSALNRFAQAAYPNLADDGARVAPEIARPWLSNYAKGMALPASEALADGYAIKQWNDVDKASDKMLAEAKARRDAAERQAKEEQELAAKKANEQKQPPVSTKP